MIDMSDLVAKIQNKSPVIYSYYKPTGMALTVLKQLHYTKFLTSIEMAERLGVPNQRVADGLGKLNRFGMVERKRIEGKKGIRFAYRIKKDLG